MSFLPATCLALVDKMTDQHINTEYARFKEADTLSSKNAANSTPLTSLSTPILTRSKVSLSRKKEVIKAALLNTISTSSVKHLTLEKEIL